jgi:hypothetical protein
MIWAIVPAALAARAGMWCFYLIDSEKTFIQYILSMTIGFSVSVFCSQLISTVYNYNDLGALTAAGCGSLFLGGAIGIISSGLTVFYLLSS